MGQACRDKLTEEALAEIEVDIDRDVAVVT